MNNIASVVVTLVLAAGGALLAYYMRNRIEEQQYDHRSSRRRNRCSTEPDFTCSVCSICKEDFRAEGIELLPCGHIFHGYCIKEWFHVRFNCPTCRFDIPHHMISEFRSRLDIL